MSDGAAALPPIALVASDLDGTLLRSDGSVSERNRAALALARSRGAEVVLTTGRPPRLVLALADQLGPAGTAGTAICANGAILLDVATGAMLDHHPLVPELARDLVARLRAALPGILFSLELGLDFARETAYHETFRPPPAPRYGDALELAHEPVTKLLGRHPSLPFDEVLATAQAVCGADAVATTAGHTVVEISAAGVTKAAMLAALCRARGLTPDAVVAFGDAPNDLELLALVGRPVAMGNAQDVVKAAVRARPGGEIAAGNDEDGVAQLLERLLGGAPPA